MQLNDPGLANPREPYALKPGDCKHGTLLGEESISTSDSPGGEWLFSSTIGGIRRRESNRHSHAGAVQVVAGHFDDWKLMTSAFGNEGVANRGPVMTLRALQRIPQQGAVALRRAAKL